jgi:hypothetical protein
MVFFAGTCFYRSNIFERPCICYIFHLLFASARTRTHTHTMWSANSGKVIGWWTSSHSLPVSKFLHPDVRPYDLRLAVRHTGQTLMAATFSVPPSICTRQWNRFVTAAAKAWLRNVTMAAASLQTVCLMTNHLYSLCGQAFCGDASRRSSRWTDIRYGDAKRDSPPGRI